MEDSPNLKKAAKNPFTEKKLMLSWCVVMKMDEESYYLHWKIKKNLWGVMKRIPATKKIWFTLTQKLGFVASCLLTFGPESRRRESRFAFCQTCQKLPDSRLEKEDSRLRLLLTIILCIVFLFVHFVLV
jgi:hypothetical protein